MAPAEDTRLPGPRGKQHDGFLVPMSPRGRERDHRGGQGPEPEGVHRCKPTAGPEKGSIPRKGAQDKAGSHPPEPPRTPVSACTGSGGCDL